MNYELLLAGFPWPWAFAASLALAAGSASFLLLDGATSLVWRLYRGRRGWAPPLPTGADDLRCQLRYLVACAPALVGILAAAFVAPGSPFLAACFVALGLLVNRYVAWRRSSVQFSEVSEEIEKLATVLHSAYLVRPAVAPALEEAARSIQGSLREAVERTLRAVWLGSDPKEAYVSLGRAIDNPYLAQLGLILERAEDSDPAQVGRALSELAGRLRRHKRLQARVKASMSVLSGTVRFLQVANVAAVGIVLTTPSLSSFYLASLSRQGLFVLALAVALGASLYFDQQLASLKERVL